MPANDIVISAYDLLSALGIGREESAAAWTEGGSACFPAARVAVPDGAAPLAGEVPDFTLADFLPTPKAYLDRQSELLLVAAALARRSGRIDSAPFVPERIGLAIGTAWGALQTLTLFFDDYVKKGPRLVKPILFPHSYANAAISLAAMEWEIRGPHLNFVSGESASTQALIAALDMIRCGEADLVLAGGAEGLSVPRWQARLATGNGTPPGEGAAVLLIEREATARARGITPAARLLGGASDSGLPGALRETAARTITAALDDAGLAPQAVRRCLTTQRAGSGLADGPWPICVVSELFGDVEGAAGALLAACALLDPAANLPALVLTAGADGTVGAVVLGTPA
jgi:3-oxoacyl-(acyl-carrier-protein) synthase